MLPQMYHQATGPAGIGGALRAARRRRRAPAREARQGKMRIGRWLDIVGGGQLRSVTSIWLNGRARRSTIIMANK